ncbi:MAG: SurA N-terminal domain-containing protein [Prevotella sp.]|nr:SurA N-terminal domain-containing protein [Prevotella sp.]
MAAIGKIRSWGPALVAVIGFALFAFIAGDMAKSCDALRNEKINQVGEVLGQKVNTQEFQKLLDEYTEVVKIQQGQDNLSDEMMNQVKDMVWNSYVQSKIVEAEAEKLGLTVTDEEMENLLNQGTNPMLLQTPFVNQQTGRFDANSLKKFLVDYKTQSAGNSALAEQYQQLYKYWTFMEKTIRQQLLSQKYQNLLAHCILSNPVEAKMALADASEESNVTLLSFPYNSIEDNKVEISEADMKSKYNEMKSLFKQYVESRDVKYVDILVEPSTEDRFALQKQFDEYKASLEAAEDPSEAVRKSASLIPYLGVPVIKTAFPADVANRLDSIAVGQTTTVYETGNTLNVVKLIAKQQLPDSIQYREIYIAGADAEANQQKADSIFTALKNGGDFEAIAKTYGQTGAKNWVTTRDYQTATSLTNDQRTYIKELNTLAVNEIKNLAQSQGNVIIQVVDRKATTTKYTAAVIRKNYQFSKETYREAFNKFSSFVSSNKTADDIEANAQKNGYTVRERNDITTGEHTVAGIRATRDALKWLFSAKEGEVSPLYECGDNNHLLVVALNKIHKAGYRSFEDSQVQEMLKAEVMKDKKAEQLIEKVKDVKSVADAKAKGAVESEVNQITFQAPVFVATTGGSEPVLSGAVAATEKGKFSAAPVKGNNGVYLFQVNEKNKVEKDADVKAQEQTLRQRALQNARSYSDELYQNAGVKDNRYIFF